MAGTLTAQESGVYLRPGIC